MSRRFVAALGLCLAGTTGCGGRAESDDTIVPWSGAVPDPTSFPTVDGYDGPSPLVPIGREWEVVVRLEEDPYFLAADERALYWVSTDVRRRNYYLRTAPLEGGGDAVTLVSGRPGLGHPVPAGDYVYFVNGGTGGRIARVPRTGGPEETLVSSDAPHGYAIDGDALYWTEMDVAVDSGRLYRTSLSERTTVLLAEGLLAPQRIALHAGFVYVASERRACAGEPGGPATGCVGGGVHRVSQAGGAVAVVQAGGGTRDMVVNDAGLYWFDTAVEQLRYVPPEGPEQTVPVSLSDQGPLAFDAGALYWASQTRVQRVPFGTNASTDLGPDISQPTSVAVANGWLYVAESGGDRISRTPTHPTTSPRFP